MAFRGEPIDTARQSCDTAAHHIDSLSDDLLSTSETLSTFATNARVQQDTLRSTIDVALTAGAEVAHAGSVTPPASSEHPTTNP